GTTTTTTTTTTTPITPVVTPPVVVVPPTTPINAVAENAVTRLPQVGDNYLRVISPTVLELERITTKDADPAQPADWNFVSSGTLVPPKETGYTYSPQPYQKVMMADFSTFTAPGEYQVVVPGLGASLPFLIDEGIAMAFTRTYALGLYHQRCGTDNALPFTRF